MVIEQLIMYSMTVFYTVLTLFRQLILLVKLRSRYFLVKRRETPPSLLTRPEYGEHHKVTLPNGMKIHYVSKGNPNGEKIILFLHGFPECWFSWRHQLNYFGSKDGYLAVAPDLRGYGDSGKPVGKQNYNIDLIVEGESLNNRTLYQGKTWIN